MENDNITIRVYDAKDREAVRRISYETSFLGQPEKFLDDQEIIADILTLYFTDYEPQSCFVACDGEKVVGYLIGARNAKIVSRTIRWKIIPRLIKKAFARKFFFAPKTREFFKHSLKGFFNGEFSMPDYSVRYPALFHINLDKDCRRSGVGAKLVECYLKYLQSQRVEAVHVGTMSEEGKSFFMKQGFKILFESKRSYLRYRLGEDVPAYILGKNANWSG